MDKTETRELCELGWWGRTLSVTLHHLLSPPTTLTLLMSQQHLSSHCVERRPVCCVSLEVGEESRPDGLYSGYIVLVTPMQRNKFPTGGVGLHSPYLSILWWSCLYHNREQTIIATSQYNFYYCVTDALWISFKTYLFIYIFIAWSWHPRSVHFLSLSSILSLCLCVCCVCPKSIKKQQKRSTNNAKI